ncbi:MAG: HD domain-containing protein [Dehalococcoidia bacterium]|nr:HD domain-containing protein [Dehalococcoidia bacterium]
MPWERDYHRILYSSAFKRLKHKTQVFYAPENDHITTRMDHSLQVLSISETICRRLSLNVDLARAIALGHDIGHAPFGHTGEETLDKICRDNGLGRFSHEVNSLRVLDCMKELHGETLNLTFEVRDGVVCHCGERYDRVIEPDRGKDITKYRDDVPRDEMPYTLEGCVVRYVDRVAYLAADVQDAIALGILESDKAVPSEVRATLGKDIGEVIGSLTTDMLEQSEGKDLIATSKKTYESIQILYEFSKSKIYRCELVEHWKPIVQQMVNSLFATLTEVIASTDTGRDTRKRSRYKAATFQVMFEFLDSMGYGEGVRPERIALDFVSGMTDNFAARSFSNIYPMRMH